MGKIFWVFFPKQQAETRNLDQVPWTEVTFISGVEIFMDDIRYWDGKNLQPGLFCMGGGWSENILGHNIGIIVIQNYCI